MGFFADSLKSKPDLIKENMLLRDRLRADERTTRVLCEKLDMEKRLQHALKSALESAKRRNTALAEVNREQRVELRRLTEQLSAKTTQPAELSQIEDLQNRVTVVETALLTSYDELRKRLTALEAAITVRQP